MATTTLTSNLKLRISSDLTDDSKFNLETLDTLGSIYQTDTNQVANIRSQTDINMQTNDPDIGGSGSGGTINIGTSSQAAGTINLYGDSITFSSSLLGTSVDPDFGSQVVQTTGGFSSTANNAFILPAADGTSGQVLSTDGAGQLGFSTVLTSTLAEDNIRIGNSSAVQEPIDTSAVGNILANTTTGLTIKASQITNVHVSASAAIDIGKLTGTASRAIEINSSGVVIASSVSSTELNYLVGVSSGLQGQLNNKQGLDATLTSLAAYNTNGILTQTAADTFVGRSIGVDDAKLTITNGDGVAGNPSVGFGTVDTDDIGEGSTNLFAPETFKTNWTQADGASKTITHSLGTLDVKVEIYDTSDGSTIFPDTTVRTDTNTLDLTGVNLPGTFDFRVLILEIQ